MRLIFAGTPVFAQLALAALADAGHEIALVLSRPDKPAGRGQQLQASPVKQLALARGFPVAQPRTLRDPQVQAELGRVGADAMVVAAYGLILPPEVLALPRLGCLNIHASLLPRWRGAAPIQRALLAGDTRTGVVIMKMDAGLDTGPMLLVRETAIEPAETGGDLHDRLSRLGAEAVVEAVDGWAGGRLAPVPQPGEGVTYAAKIAKQEAVIDWTRPAAGIDRQVRAFNPWPVAETTWRGRQLRIWSGRPVEVPTAGAAPGGVIDRDRDRLVVAAGVGAYEITRVQLAGRNALPATEFLRAHDLAGECLGR